MLLTMGSSKQERTGSLFALTVVVCPTPTSLHVGINEHVKAMLLQALQVQEGERKLRALRTVQWGASGYRDESERSERLEGAHTTEFDTVVEV